MSAVTTRMSTMAGRKSPGVGQRLRLQNAPEVVNDEARPLGAPIGR